MTTITGDNAFAAKPKSTLLPVLVVLFLISYGLLTLLVVEQNRTIQSQRSMIELLLGDSVQLAHMKGQEFHRLHPGAQSAAPQQKLQSTPNQTESNQTQSEANRASKSLKPPKGVSDTPDVRRNLFKI